MSISDVLESHNCKHYSTDESVTYLSYKQYLDKKFISKYRMIFELDLNSYRFPELNGNYVQLSKWYDSPVSKDLDKPRRIKMTQHRYLKRGSLKKLNLIVDVDINKTGQSTLLFTATFRGPGKYVSKTADGFIEDQEEITFCREFNFNGNGKPTFSRSYERHRCHDADETVPVDRQGSVETCKHYQAFLQNWGYDTDFLE